MSRSFSVAALLLLLAFSPACENLSPMEKQQYENLMAQGAEPVKEKKPWLAGSLNLLPGFGDIYTRHWGAFCLDFFTWPISILWAIPQGVVTAGHHNQKATIAYYSIGPGQGRFDPNRGNGPPPNS